MAARHPTSARERLSREGGFTLVELMVVMASGLIVASALFTILDVTLRQTTHTFSRVDATQRARTVLERISNEMHSSCVENDTTPIILGSTASSVSFWNAYGSGVSLTPVKRTITFNSGTSKLTESVYPVVSGTSPSEWEADTTPSSTQTLLTNVAQSGTTPVFQYYRADASGQIPLTPSPSLSETQAEQTIEVRMTLVVKPTGGSNQNVNLAANTVTNSVSLRLSPTPNPGAPNQHFDPCQ